MNQKFKRVILYARQHRANQGVNESLQRLVTFLQARELSTFLDVDTSHSFDMDLPVLERSSMGGDQDLIIVVGGDGSLLSAARMAIKVNVPVIGINRGRLGFLTDILPQNLEEDLSAVLEGRYVEEHRFLLHTRLQTNPIAVLTSVAFNRLV